MPLTPDKVRAALTLTNGNVSAAARMLGVSRTTIYKWLKREREYREAGTIGPGEELVAII